MKNSFLALFLLISSAVLAQAPDWSVKASDYQYSMNIIAFLNIDGNTLTNENDKVGAFSTNEARGEANVVYNSNANKYVAYLTIFSNNPGETISFKVFNSATNSTIDIFKTELFEIDAVIGGVFQSYSIASPQLKNTTTIESFTFDEVSPSSININENTIDIVLPQGSQTTNLTPVFKTTDNATIFYNGANLASGEMAINFTNEVVLQILSEDESQLKSVTISTSVSKISNPNIVNLTATSSIINTNTFLFTVDFANEVNSLKASDFSLVNGAIKQITKVDNRNYEIEIIAFKEGKVQLEISTNAVLDINNEGNLASNQLVVTYDKSSPFIKEIISENNGYQVIFSEAVTNVSLESFELNGIAKDGFELERLTQINPSTYQIQVTGLNTIKGNINLVIKANNTISDTANNKLLLQNFNTFYIDNEAPIVAVKNIELDLNGQTSVAISSSDIEVSATDNIKIKTKELSKTIFTNADIGDNTVSYTVSDLVNNSTTKELIVTVIDKSLSLDSFSLTDEIQIFPNPTIKNWLTISAKTNQLVKVHVFDINGSIILEQKLKGNEQKLNLERLSSGFYFVNIKTSKNQIIKRILKE